MALRYKEGDEEEEEGGGGELSERDKKYQAIASEIASGIKDESQQAAVHKFLAQDERPRKIYKFFSDRGFRDKSIYGIMKRSVNDIARDGRIGPAAYAGAIAEELEQVEEGAKYINGLYREGLLSKKARDYALHELEEHQETGVKRLSKIRELNLEGLAKAAVWIFIITGIAFMFFAASTITGAVVGANSAVSGIFIVGIYLFVAGVFLLYRARKK